MFGCAIAANVTYGAGILCRTYSLPSLLASAPWILGSLGTVSLDVIIFLQVCVCCFTSACAVVMLLPPCCTHTCMHEVLIRLTLGVTV